MKNKKARLLRSFRYALSGLVDAWKTERNMKIHTLGTLTAVVAAIVLGLEKWEWLFMFSAIFLVLTMEMLNTSLERVVDLFTLEFHPMARLAKNAAAGAALLAAIYALVVGILIFIPRLGEKFNFF
jgi:diacylglycerol kinase